MILSILGKDVAKDFVHLHPELKLWLVCIYIWCNRWSYNEFPLLWGGTFFTKFQPNVQLRDWATNRRGEKSWSFALSPPSCCHPAGHVELERKTLKFLLHPRSFNIAPDDLPSKKESRPANQPFSDSSCSTSGAYSPTQWPLASPHTCEVLFRRTS